MKIGVYVGSFNPPHDGHYHVAKYLINHNYVDKVLLLPTLNYWNKQDLVSVKDRINMLKFYEEENIIIDDIHNNYSFTYQVLKELEKDYPNDYLYLIIGNDNIINFSKWKYVDKILKHKVIVMNRGNQNIKHYIQKLGQDNFLLVNEFSYIPVSSSDIRKGSNKYLNIKVLKYIKNNHLYGR